MAIMSEPILEFQGKNRFLSNFWLVDIYYKGRTYSSSEHAFMTQKTFDDIERDRINFFRWETVDEFTGLTRHHNRVTTPAEAKKMAGPKSPNPITLRADWDVAELPTMEEILIEKWKIPKMRKLLLETGDSFLQEGNLWHDRKYGVCLCNQHNGEGNNFLGKMHMKIRTAIQNGEM